MTDPIADMLTRIRNGNVALRNEILMPASKQKSALAEVLKREGFIADYAVVQDPQGSGKALKIMMKYGTDRQRTISGIKRISTPGLRVYRAATEVPRVLGGLGVAVLSTSHGLMTSPPTLRLRASRSVMSP